MTKRLAALFLVLLLSIESLAAIVSDNDGSAFITKAEFDSLKNNFQSQIDQYNTSIDSKIDGAIASYLSGINVSKSTIYRVEVGDWGEVLCLNYELQQTWRPPDLDLSFAYVHANNNGNAEFFQTWYGVAGISYKRPAGYTQIRNCVNAGLESSSYTLPNSVVWIGQSNDYYEKIVGSKIGDTSKHTWGGDWYVGRYLYGADAGNMSVVKILNLREGNINNGSLDDIWAGNVHWFSSTARQYDFKPETWTSQFINTIVQVKVVGNKQYKNEHIISFDNHDWTLMSDPNWSNSLGPNGHYHQNEMMNFTDIVKNASWGCTENANRELAVAPYGLENWPQRKDYAVGAVLSKSQEWRTRYGNAFPSSAYYSGAYGSVNNDPVMSVGVLNKTYTSKNIKQWSGNRKISRDETKIVPEMNLCQGCLIAYAKNEEEFKWTPKITGSYKSGTTDVPITAFKVKLAKIPFDIKDTLPDNTKVLKSKNQTDDYLTTNSTGQCTFDVEIDEDTPIYCKWWPADDNICNNYNWNATLDLTQCGSYEIISQ